MPPHASLWLPMAPNGSEWLPIAPYGSLWLPIAPYGFPMLPLAVMLLMVALYVSIFPPMAGYGSYGFQ